MRKIFVLFAINLFLSQIHAQKIPFQIQKSEIFEDKYKKTGIVLSEIDTNGNLLLVRSYNGNGITQNEGFYLEYYDQNFKLKKDFEFEMKHPRSQKYNFVLSVFYTEKKVQIIEMYYDLNRKSYVCQAIIINEDFKVSTKELFSLTKDEMKNFDFSLEQKFYSRSDDILNIDNSGNFNSEEENLFDFSFSNKTENTKTKNGSDIIFVLNESKTSFAIALESYKDKVLKLYLFDNKLNKKFETNFIKEKELKKYTFQNIKVSNDSNSIYLLAKAYSNKLNKKEVGGKYTYELTKITIDSQKHINIDVNDHFIGSLNTFLHNETIICLGFSSNLSDNKYNGISYFKLNANTLEILNSKHNAFTEQFIIDKYGKNKEKALKYLILKKVLFTSYNDLILNAEEEYIVTSSYGGNPMTGSGGGSRTSLNHDDIISLKLNENGDLVWARNINKKQSSSTGDYYNSYSSLVKENENFFFINSSEKPKEISNNRIEFTDTRKNKSNLNLIRIKENGDFDYQEILDNEQNEVPFMVSNGITIDNSIYFLGRKGKKKQILKVTL